jgi:addiction module HigA family antidote
MTAYQLAKGLKVEQTRISEILAGKRAITADTAWRLAQFLGTSPDLWMNLQSSYDLLEAEERNRETYKSIQPHARPLQSV